MAEAVTYTNSIRFHNRNTERLREFRRTINQRNGKRKGHSSQNQEVFQEEEVKESTATCCSPGPVRWGYKNVYAASISFMLVFSAFVGLQNLQSSLNRRLGTTSLALTYVFYLFIGFATPGMVRLLKTKYSLLFGYICHTIYILSNFYPSFYTLVPSSIILGIGSGPVWAGLSTHLASVAVIVTPHTAETFNVLISKFTGLFFFIFQLTQILGNLVSSLVLFPYNSGENSTALVEVEMMPIELCNYGEARGISSMQTYILLSIYVFFDLLGIALLVIVVDKLPEDNGVDKMKSKVKVYCTEPFVDLLRLLFSQNMLLLGPLSLYNGLELSFAYSSYTQVWGGGFPGGSWESACPWGALPFSGARTSLCEPLCIRAWWRHSTLPRHTLRKRTTSLQWTMDNGSFISDPTVLSF